jgi:hypothetical protein
MSQRKRVRVKCYGAIALSPDYESPWEDVWVRWKTRPGHSTRWRVATVVGRVNLERDFKLASEGLAEAERDKDESLANDYREDVGFYGKVLRGISLHGVEINEAGEGGPDIYVNKPMLNRADAEHALSEWLDRAYYIREPKFEWDRPKHAIVSV